MVSVAESSPGKEGPTSTGPLMPAALPTYDLGASVDDLLAFASSAAERFPTGYSLDNECGCIGPGELGLIWARSGSGKSTFVLNIIANSPQVPTVMFNMEMPPRKLTEWLCGMSFDLNTPCRRFDDVLRWGPEPDGDGRYEELVAALKAMPAMYPNMHFVRPEMPSVDDLAFTLDEIEDRTKTRPQRVFIDHLTLMKDARDYDGVTKTAAKLHAWAMSEGIAVVAIQQTGRSGGDQRNDGHLPVTLSSGVYAGEHDADFIWGLYRPDRDPKFKKPREQWRSDTAYFSAMEQFERCRGITRLQLIKNRPYGEVCDEGVILRYDTWTRRLVEPEED